MGAWQHLTVFTVSTHIELNRAKTQNGSPVASGNESKELLPLLIIEFFVYYLPEPFGLRALVRVALDETAVFLPCLKIKYSRPADELLKLLWLEELAHERLIADFIEAPFERPQLVLALLDERVLNIEVHILLPVLFIDEDGRAVWLQLEVALVAEALHLHGESSSQDVLQGTTRVIIVQDELQALGYLGLPLSQVVKVGLFEEQELVDCLGEGDVKNDIVIDG